jgi:hypothetical protein
METAQADNQSGHLLTWGCRGETSAPTAALPVLHGYTRPRGDYCARALDLHIRPPSGHGLWDGHAPNTRWQGGRTSRLRRSSLRGVRPAAFGPEPRDTASVIEPKRSEQAACRLHDQALNRTIFPRLSVRRTDASGSHPPGVNGGRAGVPGPFQPVLSELATFG